jgi:Methylamine utilisation protein MauE
MSTAAQTLLAIVLLAAAALKMRGGARSADALATYGIGPERARASALALIVVAEFAIAVALLAGLAWAAAAACVLFATFALASAGALAAGRAGRPCACFGAGSRLGRSSPLQALLGALLALALALHWLAGAPSGYQRWLTAGLTVSVVAILGLAAVVLALAREVGVLRLSLASQGALEIPDEGPRVGEHQAWAGELPRRPGALLGLAVFSSDGCPMCRRLEPAVSYLAADPLLAVRVFDEVADAPTWASAAVPGSPYAVALDPAGVVLAKGTFNSLVQLEGVVATARAREAGLAVAV